jgi:hypothetical protein
VPGSLRREEVFVRVLGYKEEGGGVNTGSGRTGDCDANWDARQGLWKH